MSAITDLFQQLRAKGQKAFMPFITAGDPDLDFTVEVIQALAAEGASLLELGFPYSDPIADGPVIQASYTRALKAGLRVRDIFATIARLTPSLPIPLVGMVSYAIILRRGIEAFVKSSQESGLAGLIVPDLPVEEADPLAEVCDHAGLDLIQLITPTTPRARATQIAAHCRGFIYYVSVAGITGERDQLPASVVDNVGWLRTQTPLPICVGFGISRPEHVRMIAPVADGLIVGSAFVRRIAEAGQKPRELVLTEIRELARALIAPLRSLPEGSSSNQHAGQSALPSSAT